MRFAIPSWLSVPSAAIAAGSGRRSPLHSLGLYYRIRNNMNVHRFKYDLAISFAGEDRELASTFADHLDAAGYSIFYDEYHQAALWGKDLSLTLKQAYTYDARYCLVLLSRAYVEKPWAEFERKNAISRFIHQRGEYVLCLKVEDVELPGFPDGIAYLSLDRYRVEGVYKLLLSKLGPPDHDREANSLSESDRSVAQRIIEACYRRAIYTHMDSEIDLPAMYQSIGIALGAIQRLAPSISNQAIQFTCIQIIAELDEIERTKSNSDCRISNFHPSKRSIDEHKRRIVKLLLEVRRTAGLSMQLPSRLTSRHFFDLNGANSPPDAGEA